VTHQGEQLDWVALVLIDHCLDRCLTSSNHELEMFGLIFLTILP